MYKHEIRNFWYTFLTTKYILVGGYSSRAKDGGKSFAEELVKGFNEPVKFLECLFARSRDRWEESFENDKESFLSHLPDKRIEFKIAEPANFKEQVKWADVIYIRGGSSEAALLELQREGAGWEKELGGKTLAGSSAGAHAICKYYYGLDNLSIGQGLGMLQSKILVHYKSDYNAPNIDWDVAYKELEEYGDETLPIHALKEGEYIVIEK